jgi:hypothetical protein
MLLYIVGTVPFLNARDREMHFKKHGSVFGALNEFDYERMADAFMSEILHADLHECRRLTGTQDRIRLNGINRHYGVAYNLLTVRTYHIRDEHGIRLRGGPAGFVAFKCAEVR